MADAEKNNDKTRAYFLPSRNSDAVFTTSITSFLCTDIALDVFRVGANEFGNMALKHALEKLPAKDGVWSNQECLDGAHRFFEYASVEGFRGSPHKL